MNKQELLEKITKKKEFSELPRQDVELAFEKFDKERYCDEEKVKLTRDLLRKVFSMFTSRKLLSFKDKDESWLLRKHVSTRERQPYYEEIYKRLFKNIIRKVSVIDLGAGINGFSYKFFRKIGYGVNYVAVESIGQFVDLMNSYFKKEKISGKAYHLSLFDLDKVKTLVKKQKKPRIVFFFKTIDSLELLKRHSSKKLLLGLIPLVDKVVVSFATHPLKRRSRFRWERKWLTNFIGYNFNIIDDFEINGERYIVFNKK